MSAAIHSTFIEPVSEYVISSEFGMFSDEANSSVKEALESFINTVKLKIGSPSLEFSNERLNAFLDDNVVSENGTSSDDFFAM